MAHIPNKARERLAAGQLALGMALRQARTVEIGRVLAACGSISLLSTWSTTR